MSETREIRHLQTRLQAVTEDRDAQLASKAAVIEDQERVIIRGEAALEALKARLRQEVDAHRMTLHPHALPFTDEEWRGYLAGKFPGLASKRRSQG